MIQKPLDRADLTKKRAVRATRPREIDKIEIDKIDKIRAHYCVKVGRREPRKEYKFACYSILLPVGDHV